MIKNFENLTVVFIFSGVFLVLSQILLCNNHLNTPVVLFLITFFSLIIGKLLIKKNGIIQHSQYTEKLNKVLISQSKNGLFLEGNLKEVAKELTKQVSLTILSDRCSIWLFDTDKTNLFCQQLYSKGDDDWTEGMKISEQDCKEYFLSIKSQNVIIADDAQTNKSTSCFLENYLKPNGIKSMLDVPIIFSGEIIGVICIESLWERKWKKVEIIFAQMLASIYSFSHSIREIKRQQKQFQELSDFIDRSVLISKADRNGKITYVNQKFTNVSGYTLDEVVGKDHNIVNSGEHPKKFWKEMYQTILIRKEIWNQIITNKNKNGEFYYVDSFIKAEFDHETGEHIGFVSIRQNVTDLKLKEQEIRNRMMAINRSNVVIEFDTDGNIKFANESFTKLMSYSEDELKGRNHSIFVHPQVLQGQEYKMMWEKLKSGEFVTGQFLRYTKDGREVWLQATYNPIKNIKGEVYKIMKIATDITDSVENSQEILKKNTYLEYAAKIIRHDMHSGINTYIPRGVSSLERRLKSEGIERAKIEAPLKLLKEGLKHTQKVYKGVYEFTNLVRNETIITKTECNIKGILSDYLSSTSYISQVILSDNLPTIFVNESLFCTSIDNLIRNGLKYNDSDTKFVKIYAEDDFICVEDNGRGLSQEDLLNLSKPYTRIQEQKEKGTGLGLNICIAILEEHDFEITSEKLEPKGTKIRIKIK
jgi:PAS domain S-box-containing protein